MFNVYASRNVCVSMILAHRHLWYLKTKYQNLIEMTSNMIYIVSLAVGLKCLYKIHLNTQCVCVGGVDWHGVNFWGGLRIFFVDVKKSPIFGIFLKCEGSKK